MRLIFGYFLPPGEKDRMTAAMSQFIAFKQPPT